MELRVLAAAGFLAASALGAVAQTQSVPAPVPQQAPGTVPAPQQGPGATQQQQLQVDVPAPWRVECANTGTALECQTSQAAVLRQGQQVLATVSVRVPSANRNQPFLLVQVPLGVRVTEPISVAVDDGAAERLTVQGCTQGGCIAGGPMAEALLNRFRSGQNVRVSFANLGGDTVQVTMPLLGFVLAHDKIK